MQRFSSFANSGAIALTLLTSAPHAQADSLLETAAEAGNFTTLAAALKAGGLVAPLEGKGPFTVFAPTDAAFAKLPEATLQKLLSPEGKADLVNILTYHVTAGRLEADQVLSRVSLPMLNGQRAPIGMDDSGARVAGARITATDIRCDNGVIHVIDEVLLPELGNVVDVASAAGDFQTLLAAATRAGLAEALTGPGPFTVFAPTDEAFSKLGVDTLKDLLREENRGRLQRILQYHVVPARVYADQALTAGMATTLADQSLPVSISDGRLQVGPATVLGNDIEASNGVIHVIDQVLIPTEPAPEARGRKVIGVYLEQPGQALSRQLGIDPKTSLLITRLVDGGNAERAGLERYDVIVAIGHDPATSANLGQAKEAAGVGGSVPLTVLRSGERRHLEVEVGLDPH